MIGDWSFVTGHSLTANGRKPTLNLKPETLNLKHWTLNRIKPTGKRNPAPPRFLSLIDMGLDTVKAAVVDMLEPERIRVLGHSLAEAHGKDIAGGRAQAAELADVTNRALQEAEDATETTIGRKIVPDDAVFLLPSRALAGTTVAVSRHRPARSGTISAAELDELWQKAVEKTQAALKALPNTGSDWIIQTITQTELRLDGKLVSDPVGLRGRQLSLGAYGVTSHPATLRGIEQLAERLELNIHQLIPTPPALATLVPAGDALLLNVGASGTDCLRIRHGALVDMRRVLFGGHFFSRHLSSRFKCNLADAEALKIAFGSNALVENDVRLVRRGLEEPLHRWATEVVSAINQLFPAVDSPQLPPQLYFTGGSAILPGLKNMLLYVLKDAGRTFEQSPEIVNLGERALPGFYNNPTGLRGVLFAPALSAAKFL